MSSLSCIFIADDVTNGACTKYEPDNTNENIALYGWPHVFSCINLATANLYKYEGDEIPSNVSRFVDMHACKQPPNKTFLQSFSMNSNPLQLSQILNMSLEQSTYLKFYKLAKYGEGYIIEEYTWYSNFNTTSMKIG